jgi:glycogen synthase
MQQRFDWDAAAARYVALYRSLLGAEGVHATA